MPLLTALLLNALLLASFGWWLRREYRQAAPGLRGWLLPALAGRLVLTAFSATHPSPDAKYMSFWGAGVTASFWQHPASLALWQAPEVRAGGQVLAKYGLSNTVFFSKLLALLNLASLGSLAVNALYLSLFCFAGCWLLVRTWGQLFPGTQRAAVVALLLWPTVQWWTAGISKETVLLGSETALVALVLRHLYGPGRGAAAGLRDAVAGLVLAWLAFRMRYFFALPLLGGLAALAAVRLATRRGWLGAGWRPQVLALLAGLAVGGALAAYVVGRLLPAGFFPQQVVEIYQHGVATSPGRPHLSYPHLQATAGSLLRHAPLAILNVFARPWFTDFQGIQYVGVFLENLLLLALLLRAAWAARRGQLRRLPVALVVVLVLYSVLLAAFIGLSTPNFGTLSRYRAALLPWLLLLAMSAGKNERTSE